MNVEPVNSNDFEEKVLDQNGTVVVDFYADWCGPCHMQAPIMEEVAQDVGNGAKVVKVNIDNNQNLAAQYGVQSIPTIKIFKNGKDVKTFVGVHNKDSIIEAVEAA